MMVIRNVKKPHYMQYNFLSVWVLKYIPKSQLLYQHRSSRFWRSFTLTNKKAVKILQLCQKFSLPNKRFTIREVPSFLGTLVSSFPGVEFGPLHYRHIEVDKEANLKLNQGNFDSFMTLSHDSLEEIHWWSANILTASRNIFHNSPDVVVYTDASQMGWGAQIEHGNSTSGIWSKSESSRHI